MLCREINCFEMVCLLSAMVNHPYMTRCLAKLTSSSSALLSAPSTTLVMENMASSAVVAAALPNAEAAPLTLTTEKVPSSALQMAVPTAETAPPPRANHETFSCVPSPLQVPQPSSSDENTVCYTSETELTITRKTELLSWRRLLQL